MQATNPLLPFSSEPPGSVENQIVVVAEQVIGRHTAAGGGAHHGDAIGTLEVGLDRLIVATIAGSEILMLIPHRNRSLM